MGHSSKAYWQHQAQRRSVEKEAEVVAAVGRYIEEYCEQDDCPYWTIHQYYPTYDAECDLHLINDEGSADNTRHSFGECPVIQRLLGM